MKKLLHKHHYSSPAAPIFTHPSSPKDSQILQLCRDGMLSAALQLLNSVDALQAFTNKPCLYASLLQTCTKVRSLINGLQIHSHIIKSGLDKDRFVGNSLLSFYFKVGTDFLETQKVFDGLFAKDVISWTSMISGYVQVGKPKRSLELYLEMLGAGLEPNGFTLSAVIKACSELEALSLGRCFHCVVVSRGFESNCVISSALIDMYGRSCKLENALRVFDELLERDAICWTSVISACTRNDSFEEALHFFYIMQRNTGLRPDGFLFGSVLTACANMGRVKQGKEVHAKVFVTGMRGNVIVQSSLVDMYGKCGSINEAHRVFSYMPNRNTVSWSALLGGYSETGDFDSVIEIFRIMDKSDLYSYGTALRACASLAAVRQGKEIHCQYLRRFTWRDVITESALVDVYAKCGCVDFGYRVFAKMVVRNIITWNSMICGFAQNGRGLEALDIFDELIKEGNKPDYISFVGVLFACSHAGLVDKSREYFILMVEGYKIEAGIEHYNCIVDLLGRAGLIEEAETLIGKSNFKNNSSVWSVLLGACTTCTSSDTAERIAAKLMKLNPNDHVSYILLANVYRRIGRWNDALRVIKLMNDRGIRKMPGRSWIETEQAMGSPPPNIDYSSNPRQVCCV